jgi:hypothetical protein
VPTDRRDWRRDLILIVILLLIGAGVKGWLLARTSVLARDGVGYIRYAARLEAEPTKTVMMNEQQHPLYPLAIMATHQVLKPYQTEQAESVQWQTSAQLANLLGGVLLALPMFLIGRDLFDRRVGFWGALLFQVLPVPARVTADSLSEGTYLLFVASALYLGIRGIQTKLPRWFLLAGVAGGLAYLVRPEGALIIALTGMVLLMMQVIRVWRMPWRQVFKCGAGLGTAAVLVASPYWYTIEGLSNKPSSGLMFNWSKPVAAKQQEPALALRDGECAGGSLLFASRFSDGTDGVERSSVGTLFALYEVLDEICKSFYYITWVPSVLGLGWYVRRIWSSPGLLLTLLVMIVSFLVMWQLAVKVHYVSERHTLLIVLCGCPLSVATLFHWAAALNARNATKISRTAMSWVQRAFHRRNWRRAFQAGIVVVLAVGLIQTLKPLHKGRLGHKEVGVWLAGKLKPGDKFTDPYGFASFYSGQRLTPHPEPTDPLVKKEAHRYLLVEPGDKDVHRRRQIDHELELMGPSEVVYSWPSEKQAELVLYRSSKRKVLTSGATP